VIRSVEIKGLRGIREGKLADLTPLVVLVGPNGAGKSTVLEALLIGASPTPAQAIDRAVQRHRGVDRGARWLFWKGGEVDPALIILTADPGSKAITELSIERGGPTDATTVKYTLNGTQGAYLHFAVGNTSTIGWSNPQHVPFANLADVRLVEVHTSDLQQPLHQLFTQSVEQGRREQVKAILTELLPGLVNVEILTEGDRPLLELVYRDRSVPAVLSGDGVQSLIRLSLELAARPKGVVLVEEPELHQHPGALRQSARAILAAVRRDIQVILTTHSIELIDSLLSEATNDGHADLDKLSVYGVALKDGTLLSARYSGADVALARGDIQEDLR